jgi:predicted ATPase
LTVYLLGEVSQARVHLEQGIALYDRQEHHQLAFRYGTDLGVGCLSYITWPLWQLGYPEQALKRSHEALTLAQQLAHPYSLASALGYAAILHSCRREEHAAQEHAEAGMALSRERGIPQVLAVGMMTRGWVLALQGQGEEGIAQIHQGLAAFRAAGLELDRPRWLALLVEAYGQVEQTEEGLTVLAEALAAAHKTGERRWEAELHRLQGELLLRQASSTEEVEACFRQALEIACQQQAKSLELRAAISMARLWQQQGKRTEARALLAPIYNWFTEGFDTADLQEAKTLLEALGGERGRVSDDV